MDFRELKRKKKTKAKKKKEKKENNNIKKIKQIDKHLKFKFSIYTIQKSNKLGNKKSERLVNQQIDKN